MNRGSAVARLCVQSITQPKIHKINTNILILFFFLEGGIRYVEVV